MTLRTDSTVEAALERLAARQGVSKHEAAIRAIVEADQHVQLEDRVMDSYERLSSRYRDALDRLGSV